MPCLNRCPDCPGQNPVIPGDGPPGARVAFVGENPGREENFKRRCFTGKVGRELNENYLPLAGLDRDRVRVTNAVKCYLDGDTPSLTLAKSCAEFHLKYEIEKDDPDFVVLMGATACSLVPEIDLETHHGYPILAKLFGKERIVVPMWHPALGMHRTESMIPIRDDFKRLRGILNGTVESPVDENPELHFFVAETDRDVDFFLPDVDEYEVAIDTEWDPYEGPWCMSFATTGKVGVVIRAGSKKALNRFHKRINGDRSRCIIHNLMYDYDVLVKMGIELPLKRTVDTMMESYHLGYLPQGLKPLAWRLRGMIMRSFDEVTKPYAHKHQVEWALKASEYEWLKPEPRTIIGDDGQPKIYRPQSMSTKLKRLVTDLYKNYDGIDIHKRYDGWALPDRVMLEEKAGRFPLQSISLVPYDEAIEYAGTDAVATLRVWQNLKRELIGFRRRALEVEYAPRIEEAYA